MYDVAIGHPGMFPASAGMDLGERCSARHTRDIPRVRGDDARAPDLFLERG